MKGKKILLSGRLLTSPKTACPTWNTAPSLSCSTITGKKLRPITIETGFGQIDRPLTDADGGFGLVPKDIVPAFADAESVETLRNEDDGFNLIATIAHPGGISENYVGMIKGPVVRMQTGNLLRDEISHDYAGSVRLWGLVNGNLMWDWEIADQEGNLHKHASAELRKTSSMSGIPGRAGRLG